MKEQNFCTEIDYFTDLIFTLFGIFPTIIMLRKGGWSEIAREENLVCRSQKCYREGFLQE